MIEKLTNTQISENSVQGRSNPLTGTASANQAVFDALPKKINEKLNEVIDAVNDGESSFDAHTSDTDNPHEVTAEQVGLGRVDNTSDEEKPVSAATKEYVDTAIAGVDIPEVDLSDYYTKTEIDTMAAGVVTQINNSFYTRTQVDTAIQTAIGDVLGGAS